MRFKKLVNVLADGIGTIAVTEYTTTDEKEFKLKLPVKGQDALISAVFGTEEQILQKFAEFRVASVFIDDNRNLVYLDPIELFDIVKLMSEIAVEYKDMGVELEVKAYPLDLNDRFDRALADQAEK